MLRGYLQVLPVFIYKRIAKQCEVFRITEDSDAVYHRPAKDILIKADKETQKRWEKVFKK